MILEDELVLTLFIRRVVLDAILYLGLWASKGFPLNTHGGTPDRSISALDGCSDRTVSGLDSKHSCRSLYRCIRT